jgi:hypothetical protein
MAVWEIVKSENGSVDRVDGGGFDTWDMRGHYIGVASTIAQAWAMIHQANFERYGATAAAVEPGLKCPKCQSANTKRAGALNGRQRLKCHDCGKQSFAE